MNVGWNCRKRSNIENNHKKNIRCWMKSLNQFKLSSNMIQHDFSSNINFFISANDPTFSSNINFLKGIPKWCIYWSPVNRKCMREEKKKTFHWPKMTFYVIFSQWNVFFFASSNMKCALGFGLRYPFKCWMKCCIVCARLYYIYVLLSKASAGSAKGQGKRVQHVGPKSSNM